MRKISLKFALFALTLLASQPLLAEPAPRERLVLTTVALPPLGSTKEGPGFLEQVAREAFRRIGLEIDVDTLPGERSLINTESGLDDGDLMRAPGFEKAYPNLVQVPEKMGDMDFVAYTIRNDIKGPITWSRLADFTVGYTSGWKIYDRMVKAREVSKVRAIDDLFPLLDLKRVDLILIDRWQGLYAARMHGGAVRLLEPPLTSSPMFMYLNKKHAAIIPELTRALAAMKADGAYKRIFDATLKPFEIRQEIR
ncbi:MAG: transporter substrate-binding domain-containing protein [Pseudomonadota bacterium]